MQDSMQILIDQIKKICPRSSGNQWKLSKTHLLLHFAPSVTLFGHVSGMNSARNERHHIQNFKKPGRRARKAHKRFTLRTAQRKTDAMVIKIAGEYFSRNERMALKQKKKSKCKKADFLHGTTWMVAFEVNQDRPVVYWNTRSTADLSVDVELLQYLTSNETIGLPLQIYTELNRHNVQFRAHPNYQSNGPWYDWAWVRYEDDEGTQDVPAKFLGFVTFGQGQRFAIIHPCEYHGKQYSVLMTKWKLSYRRERGMETPVPAYDLVPTNTIVGDVFVIPDDNNVDIVTILDYSEWANEFCDHKS